MLFCPGIYRRFKNGIGNVPQCPEPQFLRFGEIGAVFKNRFGQILLYVVDGLAEAVAHHLCAPVEHQLRDGYLGGADIAA